MKLIVGVLVVFSLIGCSTASKKESYNPVQNYTTYQLPNGLNVMYVPESKLPYLSLSLAIFSGSANDPKESKGLTYATMEMLTKGTQNRSANQLSEDVEILGADLDTSVDKEYSSLTLEGLSWHEDKLIELFSEMILKPRFSFEELDRYKKRTLAQIQQILDQPSYLAGEILERNLYSGTSYADRDVGTLKGVQNLSLKNVTQHYEKILNPENMWLIVVGKTSDGFKSKIGSIFSKIKKQKSKALEAIKLQPIQGRKILIVDKPDAAQAEIRLGHYGIQRDLPEYMSVSLANAVLGQGFTSRLVDRVRDQLGLTYSISSSFEVRKQRGYFSIKTFTQNERVGQTVSEILKLYSEFQSKGITSKELRQTQDGMIGKFPLLLETPEKLAYNLMILRYFGISDEYLLKYRENVSSLKLDEVNQAIQKYFDPQNAVIVILGRRELIEPQVRDLGTIEIQSFKKYYQ